MKLVKNDERKVRATCVGGFEWVVYASRVHGENTYQVKTFNGKHTCGKTYTNRNVTVLIPIPAFKERVRKEMKVDVSRDQLYRAKRKATQLIYGSDLDQYGRLWDYCEELRRSNPGSTVVMDAPVDEESEHPRFRRLYIFLEACKSGYLRGCRKVIGVDGCHLKGEYTGQLLTAIGIDPNNAMYPLAYCLVEVENKDTWSWFLELIKVDLGITPQHEHEWTFINDRQKGLLPALNELFPASEHRHCCKHLLSNFLKQFKGMSLELQFWGCAKATYVSEFEGAMEKLNKEDSKAVDWLSKEPPRYWSRSHFRDVVKCDMICNNLCEAFNRAILDAREKPIIEMLEWIRCYLMRRMLIRREWIKKFNGELLPNIYAKMESNKDDSATCIADWFGELQFQVRCMHGEQYTVDLKERTCSCRKWDLCGIPCPHAIAAIQNRGHRVEAYVSPYYSKTCYLNAYNPMIYPINGYKMWPKSGFTLVLPPLKRRKPGRPRILRVRDPNEYVNPKNPTKLRKVGQNSVCCRRCGKHGHNRRTCTTPLEKGTKNVAVEKGEGSRSVTELGTSRGIGVTCRGRGDRVHVNTPTNFAQASQTSLKSTTTQVTKSQKVQKFAPLSSLHATSRGSQN